MFFTFTKRKIINLVVLSTLIGVAALSSFSIENHYKVSEAYGLYTRRVGESLNYWWSKQTLKRSAATVNYGDSGRLARSIPVLAYHGLPDSKDDFNPTMFSEHMHALTVAGWKSITLDEFEHFIRSRIALPEKSFLLTFDDGRKDTFYPADPILSDLGLHAVMFAITKRSTHPSEDQSPYYLSPYELQALENSDRWEVESHGRDSHDWYFINKEGDIGHYYSNLFWFDTENRQETPQEFRDRVVYDMSNSKKDLEETLGKKIRAFAFPFGDYGQDGFNYPEATDIVSQEVSKYYRLAFYQNWIGTAESFNYPSDDKVMMKRIEPAGDWTGEHLVEVMEAGLAKDLPYTQFVFGDEWVGNWGDVLKGDELTLKAKPDTTGASVGLRGSWWWTDYTFSTTVNWISGSNVVLAARRADEKNYFGCNFDNKGKVGVKSLRNGISYTLAENPYTLPKTDLKLSIKVNGGTVSCLVNDAVAISVSGVSQRLANGGVGMEIWDATNGKAEAKFDNIEISK